MIVRSTIDLGRNPSLRIVAEGIETHEVLAELRALGCDALQGFLPSRPVSADPLARWASDTLTRQTAPPPTITPAA